MATTYSILPSIIGFVALCVLFFLGACSNNTVPPGRTDKESVDTVLEAIEQSDPDDLVSLVRLEEMPCVRGGPTEISPVCSDDQKTGTLVDTFAAHVCIGLQHEVTTERQMADWIVDQDLSVYGVYELPASDPSDAKYTLLFNHPNTSDSPSAEFGLALHVSGHQIVSYLSHCGDPASKFSEFFELGEPILVDAEPR